MQNVDKLKIDSSDTGCVLAVKAVPASSRDKIAAVLGDRLKITVTAAPEKGKANKAIAKILAKALGISASDVTLVSGQTNANKDFLIAGLDKNTLVGKLSKL